MTIKPIQSKEWITVNEADTKVRVSRFHFRKTNDLFEQILFALNNDDLAEQATALRFIRDESLNESEFKILTPAIINIAINGNTDNLILARDRLIRGGFNRDYIIREKLTPMFNDFLKTENQYIYIEDLQNCCFFKLQRFKKKINGKM